MSNLLVFSFMGAGCCELICVNPPIYEIGLIYNMCRTVVTSIPLFSWHLGINIDEQINAERNTGPL